MLRDSALAYAALLTREVKDLMKYGKYIKSDTLDEHQDLVLIVKEAYDFAVKHNVVLSYPVMVDKLSEKVKLNDKYQLAFLNVADVVHQVYYCRFDYASTKAALTDLVKVNSTIDLVNSIADRIDNGVNVTPQEAKDMFGKSSIDLDDSPLDIGFEGLTPESLKSSFALDASFMIPTGFPIIDANLKGLSTAGEIGIIVAPANRGKTAVMCALARNMVLMDYNVLFMTGETHIVDLKKRFWAGVLNTPINDLHHGGEDLLKRGIDHVKAWGGQMYYYDFIEQPTTTNDIDAVLERYKESNIRIDIIVLDYIDLLRSTSSSRELRHQISDTYKALRGVSVKHNIPVWSASQTNRAGANAVLLTEETIGEDYGKVANADKIISFNQTIAEYESNVARFFVMKTRATKGKFKAITLDVDFNTMQMTENKELTYEEHKQLISDLKAANKGVSTDGN